MHPAEELKATLARHHVPFHLEPVAHDGHPWVRTERDPAREQRRMKSVTPPAPIVTREHYSIYQYLPSMPHCVEVMELERGDKGTKIGKVQPLDNVILIALQHIDGKCYGALSVLREWGATDMVTVFVGYNELMEQIYRPELNEIPDDQFRTCIIQAIVKPGSPLFAEGTYEIVQSFSKFPKGEELPNDAFDQAFKQGGIDGTMDFLEAMQCLTVYQLLQTLARARATKKKVMVFEDGGYLHPIVNQACLENWTVAGLRKKFAVPADPATDKQLPATFKDAIAGVFVGSTEYTRNGYNRSAALQAQYKGKLASPLFSIACSQVKTRFEGDGIAQACLAAITQVLYSTGASVKFRNVLVMGARGNIGRFFMQHIANLLDNPAMQLLGCDLKVAWPKSRSRGIPSWAIAPDVPNKPCRREAAAYKKFPRKLLLDVDLIFGVTGGPTVGQPTIDGDDIEDWLANGTRPELFMASGSTKTSEFENVLRWLNQVLTSPADKRKVGGKRVVSVTPGPIDDMLSDAAVEQMDPNVKLPIMRNFGTRFDFVIATGGGKHAATVKKTIYLMNNTMPINFMFYGTPAEILDYSYAQLLDITAKLAERAPALKTAQVFATDYSLAATKGVWRAQKISKDFPVPQASGQSLPGGD